MPWFFVLFLSVKEAKASFIVFSNRFLYGCLWMLALIVKEIDLFSDGRIRVERKRSAYRDQA